MTADQTFQADQTATDEQTQDHVLSLSQALLLPRIVIEDTQPAIDGGQFAVKAIVGQKVTVSTKVYADGHDKLSVVLRWHEAGSDTWHSTSMRELGNDSWEADLVIDRIGVHGYCIDAWIDQFASYRYELEKKYAAGVTIDLELEEGRLHLEHAAARSQDSLAQQLRQLHDEFRGLDQDAKVALLLQRDTQSLMSLPIIVRSCVPASNSPWTSNANWHSSPVGTSCSHARSPTTRLVTAPSTTCTIACR